MNKRTWYRKKRLWLIFFLLLYGIVISYHQLKPLPKGISYEGKAHSISEGDIEFLTDLTYSKDGEVQYEQEIFNTVYETIADAEEFLIIDMFMINNFSSESGNYLPLSEQLTDHIARQKERYPDLKVVLITDPLNKTYGSHNAQFIRPLEELGVEVIYTDLRKLRDPNPLYSGLWRMFIQWFGQEGRGWLPNPFGEPAPDVTARSYLEILNIKANHRKVVITEDEGLVISANSHDASSYHSNIGFKVKGEILKDLVRTEKAVAKFSGGNLNVFPTEKELEDITTSPPSNSNLSVKLVTEQKIQKASVEAISQAEEGEEIWIGMFYLADRDIIEAIEKAANRGVKIHLILDPNKNAFGQQKIGIPNVPVADELMEDGNGNIEIKWYNVNKEQYHTKLLYANYRNSAKIIGGSANFTSRNLDNYNLETNLVIESLPDQMITQQVDQYFQRLWNNEDASYTLAYEEIGKFPLVKRIGYTLQKMTMFTTY